MFSRMKVEIFILLSLLMSITPVENISWNSEPTADLSWDNDLKLMENESVNVTFTLSHPLGEILQVFLNTSHQHSSKNVPPIAYPHMLVFEANTTQAHLEVNSQAVGQMVIAVNVSTSNVKLPMSKYLRIYVIESHVLKIINIVIGWIYFVAWSISFYPQVILNFQRKSKNADFSPASISWLPQSLIVVALYHFFSYYYVLWESQSSDDGWNCLVLLKIELSAHDLLFLLFAQMGIVHLAIVECVIGLNFDFLAYNITGFVAYCLYNIGLFWIPLVQQQYIDKYPDGVIPVQANDVFFTLHACLLTTVTIIQCIIYERGGQRVSIIARVLLVLTWTAMFILLFVAVGQKITWLVYLMVFSYVKLGVTLIKYIPQVYMNYRRKSTVGWSIGNVLLDFTGGSFSILQMLLQSYNNYEWKLIFGDPTKFGLGLFSILFDIIFMIQHYGLYRHPKKSDPLLDPSHSEDDED